GRARGQPFPVLERGALHHRDDGGVGAAEPDHHLHVRGADDERGESDAGGVRVGEQHDERPELRAVHDRRGGGGGGGGAGDHHGAEPAAEHHRRRRDSVAAGL
ncbi:MAG: NADH-ubiquinone oxidoreductase chain K, partial [uncultured Thermomicrobiales bacterium]